MPDISVNRTTYIKIGSASPITTGIAEGSMLIDRVLFAEDFKFGQFASSRFEIQIYGINNVAGQSIEVYQTENNVRTDLFVGQIESSRLDNAGYYRDIIAYDKFYFIAKKNVADWFNSLWTNNTQISVLDAFKSLLTYFGIGYDQTTVIAANFSGNLYKTSVPSFEKISFKDMVKFLLEPLALIPYINASGNVAVYAPLMANNIDLYPLVDGVRQTRYDTNQSVFEEYEVQPMQWVGITNIDSAILAQEEITGNTSDIRYDLPYNPIRLDLYVEDAETAQEAALEDFIDKASFDAYTPCEVFMIVSDMSIKLGDKITTTRGTSYVSEMILSGPMLVDQQLISRGSQVQQEVEEEYDPVFAYLDNRVTEAAEDLQDQIDNYQPSEEYLNRVNEFSNAVASGMGLKTIKRIQDGATITYFYAPDANGAITNSKFVFVVKSNGFFWTDEWKGNADASSEGATFWGQGIGANGSSLLKVLNAYKISADIIDTGELVIYDNTTTPPTVIHKFSFNDKSAIIGGSDGISYSTSGSNANKIVLGSDVIISGDVTIGGLSDIVGDAVEDAVSDLNIRAVDHQTTKYLIYATKVSDPPYYGYSSYTTYYYAYSNNQMYAAVLPYNSSIWSSDPSNIKTYPNAAAYNYSNHYVYAFTRYTYDNNSTQDTSVVIVCEKGTQFQPSEGFRVDPWSETAPDTSTQKGKYFWTWTEVVYTDDSHDETFSNIYLPKEYHTYIKYSDVENPTNSSQISSTPNTYIGICVSADAVAPTNPSYYTWSKFAGTDGANGNQVFIRYSANSNGSSMTETPQSNTQYIGIYSGSSTSAPTDYGQYRWTKIKGEQGNAGVGIDHTNVTYGIGSSGTSSSGITFSSTIPDISLDANKGKYLWTKTDIYYTSAPNTVAKTAYSVAYIADDGAPGQPGSDGVGISSITQYFYPSTSNAVAQIPAIGSGSWKDAPSKFTGNDAFSASKPYLWTYTHTVYSNGTTSDSERYILGVWGQDGQDGSGTGAQGRGISAITPQYYLSTSNSTQTGGSWSDSPQAYSYYPSASGTKSQGSYSDIITGLSLSSGTTYTVKWKYNPSVNYNTQIAITNSSNTNLYYINTSKNKTSGSFEYTPTSDYSNAKIRIQSSSTSISSYEVTIMGTGLETKKYYWQSDKIVWDDGSAATWTTPVLISALNKAIWDANEANAAIGLWCYENDVTHIDGGKIYTGTITANQIAANSVTTEKLNASDAMLEKLLAYDADVVGTLTVTNNTNVSPAQKGRIEILDELSPDESTAASYRDSIAYAMYGVSYNNITGTLAAIKKLIVSLRALIQYTKDNAKLIIKKETNSTDSLMALYPNGIAILSWDGSAAKASLFGHNSTIGGNLTVQGDLTVGGSARINGVASEVGSVDSQIDTVSSTQVSKRIRIPFDNEYSSRPKVFVTVWDENVEGFEYHFLSFSKTYDDYTGFLLEVYTKDSWYYENGYDDDDNRLPTFTVDYVVYS